MADWPVLSVTRIGKDDVATPGNAQALPNPASANTKGAWATVSAAVPFDLSAIIFEININNQFGLLDIGIGPSGQELIVVPNFQVGASAGQLNTMYWLPLFVPKGTRIAARIQGPSTTPNADIKVQFIAAGGFPDVPPPTRWEDWGTVLSASRGTVVTTGAGVKGTAVTLVAATAFSTRWLGVSVQAVGSIVAIGVDLLIDGQVMIPDIRATNQPKQQIIVLPFTIPKLSAVAAQSQASSGGVTLAMQAWGGG